MRIAPVIFDPRSASTMAAGPWTFPERGAHYSARTTPQLASERQKTTPKSTRSSEWAIRDERAVLPNANARRGGAARPEARKVAGSSPGWNFLCLLWNRARRGPRARARRASVLGDARWAIRTPRLASWIRLRVKKQSELASLLSDSEEILSKCPFVCARHHDQRSAHRREHLVELQHGPCANCPEAHTVRPRPAQRADAPFHAQTRSRTRVVRVLAERVDLGRRI